MGYFSREIFIHRHWRQAGSRCPIGLNLNLLERRELFGNLYELKSRIRLREDYNDAELIYRMRRFDRFSSNFAKTF